MGGRRGLWARLGLCATGFLVAAAGAAGRADDAGSVFVAQCVQETMAVHENAAPWADGYCRGKLTRGRNANAMLGSILSLAPAVGAAPFDLAAAKRSLNDVRWSGGAGDALERGVLGDLTYALYGEARAISGLGASWGAPAASSPFDLVAALKLQGVAVETVGCPRFALASSGLEKVMRIEAPGREPFLLAVYGRPAPTGFEQGVYDVRVWFESASPSAERLRARHHGTGGALNWAGEPIGWDPTCPDPE